MTLGTTPRRGAANVDDLITLNRSVTKNPECSLAKQIIQPRNQQEHHHNEQQNRKEVAKQLASGGGGNLLQLRDNFAEECKNTAEETALLIALRGCARLSSLSGSSRRCHFFCPFLYLKKYARSAGVQSSIEAI